MSIWSRRNKGAVFERGAPATAINNLRIPIITSEAGEGHLESSRSAPFITSTHSTASLDMYPHQSLSNGLPESPVPSPATHLRVSSPQSSSLAPPSFLQTGSSAFELEATLSAISVLSEEEARQSPRSPRDWRSMQVRNATSPTHFSTHAVIVCVYCMVRVYIIHAPHIKHNKCTCSPNRLRGIA